MRPGQQGGRRECRRRRCGSSRPWISWRACRTTTWGRSGGGCATAAGRPATPSSATATSRGTSTSSSTARSGSRSTRSSAARCRSATSRPGRPSASWRRSTGSRGRPTSSALTDVLVGSIPAAEFMSLMRQYPSVAEAVLVKLADLVRALSQRLYELSEPVPVRICTELIHMAEARSQDGRTARLRPPPKHADIASRLLDASRGGFAAAERPAAGGLGRAGARRAGHPRHPAAEGVRGGAAGRVIPAAGSLDRRPWLAGLVLQLWFGRSAREEAEHDGRERGRGVGARPGRAGGTARAAVRAGRAAPAGAGLPARSPRPVGRKGGSQPGAPMPALRCHRPPHAARGTSPGTESGPAD